MESRCLKSIVQTFQHQEKIYVTNKKTKLVSLILKLDCRDQDLLSRNKVGFNLNHDFYLYL
jgi:hypothetical protein